MTVGRPLQRLEIEVVGVSADYKVRFPGGTGPLPPSGRLAAAPVVGGGARPDERQRRRPGGRHTPRTPSHGAGSLLSEDRDPPGDGRRHGAPVPAGGHRGRRLRHRRRPAGSRRPLRRHRLPGRPADGRDRDPVRAGGPHRRPSAARAGNGRMGGRRRPRQRRRPGPSLFTVSPHGSPRASWPPMQWSGPACVAR